MHAPAAPMRVETRDSFEPRQAVIDEVARRMAAPVIAPIRELDRRAAQQAADADRARTRWSRTPRAKTASWRTATTGRASATRLPALTMTVLPLHTSA